VLNGAIHAFDLSVGPGMIGLGETVIDVVTGAGRFKGMSAEELASLPT